MSKKKPLTAHKILNILGNKYRMQIAKILLKEKQVKVGDINSKLNSLNQRILSQPGISQHLSKMRLHGIVEARRDHREIFYTLSNSHVAAIVAAAEKAVA